MSMNRHRSQLQAYLAGIVDGEGSFGIYDLDSYQARLTVGMQDPEAVLLFKRLYPDGTFSRTAIKDRFEYRVVYSQHRAFEITCDLIPFLIIKQRQAKVVRAFLVHRRREHQKKNAGTRKCSRCIRLSGLLRGIRREAKGVNSVNALLSHEMREYRAKREDVEQDVKVMHGLLEGVETRLMPTTGYKAMSAPEQEIVQAAAQ